MSTIFILALTLALLSSIAGGVVGSYIVVKRITMLAGSISHSIFSGMGLCLWLQKVHGLTYCNPLVGALVSGVIAAAIMGFVHIHYREREDAILSAIWSIGMAIGVIFIFLTPGGSSDLHAFLFGNLLWVTPFDIGLIAGIDVVIVILAMIFHRRFLAICFDEEAARLEGLFTRALYIFLLSLVALAIVALIKVVGIILIMTLLAIPPMIASNWVKTFSRLCVGAILLGALFASVGCFVGYGLDWPLAPTIALIAGAGYLVSLAVARKKA